MSRARWPYPLMLGAVAGALLVALIMPIRDRGGSGTSVAVGTATPEAVTATTAIAGSSGAAAVASAEHVASARAHSTAASGGGVATTASGTPEVGVTDKLIRIGVGLPDLGAVAALGPNYDEGDTRAQMAAVLAGWKDAGLVPINGRDVQFVYRSYDIVGTDQQRAACIGWAEDDRVYAVITVNNYWAAGECVAREHHIPLIVNDIYEQSVIDRSAPYLFTVPYSLDQLLRNWAHFAVANGVITKKSRIGFYYGNGTGGGALVESELVGELTRMGYGNQIVERVATDNYSTGGAEDPVAAQRFAASRVDVALLTVSAINQTNFQQAAESLGYRPKYLGSDFLFTTNDTAAATFSASQYDGTFGMTSLRFGEESAGRGLTAEAKACAANYLAHGGHAVSYKSQPAEWMALQQGCDAGRLLLAALRSDGTAPTRAGLIAALESSAPMPMGIYGDVDFDVGDHTGTAVQRPLRWSASCTCWRAVGAFAPYWTQ